jgi:hypothetical protein
MQEAEVSITLEPKMPHISQYGQLLPPETKPTDTEYSQILDVLVSKINPHFKAWVKDDGRLLLIQLLSSSVRPAPSPVVKTDPSSPTTNQTNSMTMWKYNL